MRPRRKPIRHQVIVITGATSGIGLATARLAASRGAQVVLVSRNEPALRDIVDEIEARGGTAAYAVADVGDPEQVERAAASAVERFGRIDTWVNNAAVSIYGELTRIPLEEQRRLFDTNYWGTVHGSRTAVEHLRTGGALINLGSVLSDRAIPIQGPYCASKHAVRGFTESLRMELARRGLPISVTLIKPSAIDTPYKNHAKNYLPHAPKNPPPVYAPRVVARAILHCAEHPTRHLVVGGAGQAIAMLGSMFPRLTDRVMERIMVPMQMTDDPPRPREHHNLFHPIDPGQERGRYPHPVHESSLYTRMAEHPVVSGLALAGAGAALGLMLTRGRDGA